MDRMIFRKQPACAVALIVAAAFLFSGCDDGLLDDIQSETRPAAPGALTVTPGDTTLSVSWVAVSGAASYDVYTNINTNDSGTASLYSTVTDKTVLIAGLNNGDTCYVWIKAKNSSGSSGFSTVGYARVNSPFTSQNLESTATSMVGSSYTDSYNAGVGQSITLPIAYVPTSYSVYVHSANYFKKIISGSSNAAAVDLQLAIWHQNDKELLATATAHVNARTASGEEEVIFNIAGCPAITINTPILFAVYLPGSLASDIRGELLCYQSGTEQYSEGIYWKSNQAIDTNIIEFDTKWAVGVTATWDLKFKLVGVEQ